MGVTRHESSLKRHIRTDPNNFFTIFKFHDKTSPSPIPAFLTYKIITDQKLELLHKNE